MFEGRKVVVCIPAGRRRYMEVLLKYLDRSPIVDRIDLWLNTLDVGDRNYLAEMTLGRNLGQTLRRTRLIAEGDPGKGNHNIHTFYRHAADPDTLYVRLDDDIVYLDPDFFPELLHCRLTSPENFLLSANVVNNAVCDHLHQRTGSLGSGLGLVGYACMDAVGWNNPHHAEYVHRSFLADAEAGTARRWRLPDWTLSGAERFSINAICWTGEDMARVIAEGGVGADEEACVSTFFPRAWRRFNKICGKALCAHFAYHTQRGHLDDTDLLNRYRELASSSFRYPCDGDLASASRQVTGRQYEEFNGITCPGKTVWGVEETGQQAGVR